VTAPAIPAAGRKSIDLSEFPRGTELVEIGGEQKLRGIFMPGEPVVLLFCESRGSITNGPGAYPLAWDLRALGMGLLCVDYRGVGASDGEGSPENMPADARIAWREAVRRAGDPSRVVVRGLSLGALAVSLLLEERIEPAAAVVGAPVRAETAVSRFADEWGESGLERISAKWFVRRPVRTDIVTALRDTKAPTLAACGTRDPYLDDAERTMFQEAVDFYLETDDEHDNMLWRARGVLPMERALYLRLFPELPRLDERIARVQREVNGAPPRSVLAQSMSHHVFEVPSTAAAVALTWKPGKIRTDSMVAGWLRSAPALPLDAAVALTDLSGADLVDFGGWMAWLWQVPKPHTPEQLLKQMQATRRHAKVMIMVTSHSRDGSIAVREMLVANRDAGGLDPEGKHVDRLRLPENQMLRQGFLLALKAAHIPARPVEGGVQVWDNHWRFIALP